MSGLKKRKNEGVSESGMFSNNRLLTGRKKLKSGENMTGAFSLQTGNLVDGKLVTSEYICQGKFNGYDGTLENGVCLYNSNSVYRGKYQCGKLTSGLLCQDNHVLVGEYQNTDLVSGVAVTTDEDLRPDLIKIGLFRNDKSKIRLTQGTYVDPEENMVFNGSWDKSDQFQKGLASDNDVIFYGTFSDEEYDKGTRIFRNSQEIHTGTFVDTDLTSGVVVTPDKNVFIGNYSDNYLESGIKVNENIVTFRKSTTQNSGEQDNRQFTDMLITVSDDHQSILIYRGKNIARYNFIDGTASLTSEAIGDQSQLEKQFAEKIKKHKLLVEDDSDNDEGENEMSSAEKGKEKVPLSPMAGTSEEIVVN
jgi:hypothetical protein